MTDDVLTNKARTIERCVARAREEHQRDPASFEYNITHQDAAILNIQRACEAALDMGQYIIWQYKLGIPKNAHDVFTLLGKNGWITEELVGALQQIVEFRDTAIHNHQTLEPIRITTIINHCLDDVLQYTKTILLHSSKIKEVE